MIASDTFTITTANTNDAPTTAAAVESNSGSEDQAITGTLLAGTDIDGDPLTLGGGGWWRVVVMDTDTGAYTFTPTLISTALPLSPMSSTTAR